MSAAVDLLTIAEAAARLKCSARAVRRLLASGDLLRTRIGSGPKSDRVHPDDLAAYVNQRRAEAREQSCRSSADRKGAGRSLSASRDEHTAALAAVGRIRKLAKQKQPSPPKSGNLRLVRSD